MCTAGHGGPDLPQGRGRPRRHPDNHLARRRTLPATPWHTHNRRMRENRRIRADVLASQALAYLMLAGYVAAVYAAVAVGIGAARAARNPTSPVGGSHRHRRGHLRTGPGRGLAAGPVAHLPAHHHTRRCRASPSRPPPPTRPTRSSRRWPRPWPTASEQPSPGCGCVSARRSGWPRPGPGLPPVPSGCPWLPGSCRESPGGPSGGAPPGRGARRPCSGQGDRLTPVERRLLGDLAAQAGLALRNVRLTAELEQRVAESAAQAAALRASRARIVAAQDAERRRLERDLHDGAQQHLVALTVKLGLVRVLAGRSRPGAWAAGRAPGEHRASTARPGRLRQRGLSFPARRAGTGRGTAGTGWCHGPSGRDPGPRPEPTPLRC